MWRWYVGLSGVIVTRRSTSFQVYGLISQEPYIYKSVTTETKSIKSALQVRLDEDDIESRVISLLRDMLCGI